MFFKTNTVYKVYTTRKGAESYTARNTGRKFVIEEISNMFYVVGA